MGKVVSKSPIREVKTGREPMMIASLQPADSTVSLPLELSVLADRSFIISPGCLLVFIFIFFFFFSQGEIRMVFFKEAVSEKFQAFQEGKVYTISKPVAKQAFGNSLKFELQWKEETTCEELDLDVVVKVEPVVTTPLSTLPSLAKNSFWCVSSSHIPLCFSYSTYDWLSCFVF